MGLADLAGVMTRLPQILVNVPHVDKSRADSDPAVTAAVREAEVPDPSLGLRDDMRDTARLAQAIED